MSTKNCIIDGFKICSHCHENKSVSDFYSNKRNRSGIASWCKVCCRALDKTRPPKSRGFDPAYWRNLWLQREYGISLDEFERIFETQGRRCKICKTPTPRGNNQWHVDHNHNALDGDVLVRGILCMPCNTLLGMAQDNPEILESAIQYVLLTTPLA